MVFELLNYTTNTKLKNIFLCLENSKNPQLTFSTKLSAEEKKHNPCTQTILSRTTFTCFCITVCSSSLYLSLHVGSRCSAPRAITTVNAAEHLELVFIYGDPLTWPRRRGRRRRSGCFNYRRGS